MKLAAIDLLSLGVVLVTFLRKTVQVHEPLWEGQGDPSAPANERLCSVTRIDELPARSWHANIHLVVLVV